MATSLLTIPNVQASSDDSNVTFLNREGRKSTSPYSEAVKVGDLLMLSGQIGFNPKTRQMAEGFKGQVDQTLPTLRTL